MDCTSIDNGLSLQVKQQPVFLPAEQGNKERISVKVFIVSHDTQLSSSLLNCIIKIKQAGSCRVVNSFFALQALHCSETAIIIIDANMLDVKMVTHINNMLSHHIIIIAGKRPQPLVGDLQENVFAFVNVPVVLGDIFMVLSQSLLYLGESNCTTPANKHFVLVKSDYKLVKINVAEILFIEGMKDYVKLWYTGKQSPLTTLQNLKEFEKKLPADQFIRVHKSYIVALNHIDCIARNEIVIGSHSIPVGEAYRKSVNNFINLFS